MAQQPEEESLQIFKRPKDDQNIAATAMTLQKHEILPFTATDTEQDRQVRQTSAQTDYVCHI